MNKFSPGGMNKFSLGIKEDSMTTTTSKTETTEGAVSEFVTAVIGGALFGLPPSRGRDVVKAEARAPGALSSGEIGGVLNRRGRSGTGVGMCPRLCPPKKHD